MGLGGATEMDKVSEDIRAELEQNRQYLVRALHAVETSTAECKEETRLATLKAENALSRLHLLESAGADRDAELARIQHEGEQRIVDLQNRVETQSAQLEEQRELSSGLQDALEAQTLTIRDLREQVYSLQLRVLKNDEDADRDGAALNRVAHDKIAAVSSRAEDCHRQLRVVCDEVQQQLEGIASSMQQQEVKLHAQISNSEALVALKLEELEKHIQYHLSDSKTSTENQKDVAALEVGMADLHTRLAAIAQESKSEVEAMFKGEMILTQRINSIEGNMKGEISAQIAQLEAAVSLAKGTVDEMSNWVQTNGVSKDDLQGILDETMRKDNEFRAKFDLVAEEMDKHAVEISLQKRREEQTPDSEVAQILPKIESLEHLIQSVEALMTKESSPSLRPRDSPRASALHAFQTMQSELKEHSEKIQSLEIQMAESTQDKMPEANNLHTPDDVALLQQHIEALGDSVKALGRKMDEVTAASSSQKELSVKAETSVNKAIAVRGKEETVVTRSPRDDIDISELQKGLGELRQEHMSLFGRVVSMEEVNKTAAAAGRATAAEASGANDSWAMEGRVSRIELAMIDILEKQTGAKEEELDGSNWHAMLERLQKAEDASTNIMDGVQKLTDTMAQVLERQRALDERVLSEGSDQITQRKEEFQLFEHPALGKNVAGEGRDKSEDVQDLIVDVKGLKGEHSAWKKEVERVVKLTTDAFGPKSPFVSKEILEKVRTECMERLAEIQRDLNEGAGFTPRNLPQNETTHRSHVVSTGSLSSPERLSQEHLQADVLRFEFEKDVQDLRSHMQSMESRVGVVEAGLLSGGPAEASSPDKRESISLEIMQQYQVAIGLANDRIGEQQVAIEALRKDQEKWNAKLDQTLEVANEAFGERTPFVMKGQVEHLESDHQHTMEELTAQRRSIAELQATLSSMDKDMAEPAAPGAKSSAAESLGEAHMAFDERLSALEPMRDEFVAEKMHTDSEIQKLKQQLEDLVTKHEREKDLARSKEKTVEKFDREGDRPCENENVECEGVDPGIMRIERLVDSLQDEVQREVKVIKDSMLKQQEQMQSKLQEVTNGLSANRSAKAEPAVTNTSSRDLALLRDEVTSLKQQHDELGRKLTQQVDEKLKAFTDVRIADAGAQNNTALAKHEACEDEQASGRLVEVEKIIAALKDDVDTLQKKDDEVLAKLDGEMKLARQREDDVDARCSSVEKRLGEEIATAREREESEAKAKDGAILHLERLVDSLQDDLKTFGKKLDDARAETQQEAVQRQKEWDAASVQRQKEWDAASKTQKDKDDHNAKVQKDAEEKMSAQLAAVRDEVAVVVEEMKRQKSVEEANQKDRQAAADAAAEAESKLANELSEVRMQVVALRDATSIEGELHKSLHDVESAVADCEAGIKNIKSGLDELGKKVEMVEKANKQIDLSALSRISAQIAELDEAMEVRENENAALDGRVEKIEQDEVSLKDDISALQRRVDDVNHQCKVLNEQAQAAESRLDDARKHAVTMEEVVKIQSALDEAATKGELSRIAQKVTELEERHRQQEMAAEGSVTARSLHSEREGSFSEFHDELAIASEGSARIRALAARVRGVTQSAGGGGKSVTASPIDAPTRGGGENSILSPSQIATPRSMLEETAERIREWEIRNQGIAERSEGSDGSGAFQTSPRRA